MLYDRAGWVYTALSFPFCIYVQAADHSFAICAERSIKIMQSTHKFHLKWASAPRKVLTSWLSLWMKVRERCCTVTSAHGTSTALSHDNIHELSKITQKPGARMSFSCSALAYVRERETGGGEAARQREGSIYCHVREDLAREGALFHWALLTSHTHSSNSLPCILKKNLQKMDVVWLAQIISSLASELLQVWKKKGTPIHTTYASACCRKKQIISWDNILVCLAAFFICLDDNWEQAFLMQPRIHRSFLLFTQNGTISSEISYLCKLFLFWQQLASLGKLCPCAEGRALLTASSDDALCQNKTHCSSCVG